MPEQLFLVSIGPVQEFIAAARRSRDLWFGSWLLSDLAKVAAQTIINPPWSGKLIFPALDAAELKDDIRSAPNRILAEIGNAVRPADLGARVTEAIHKRLFALSEPALAGKWPADRPFLEALAQLQLRDLLDHLIFWGTVPLEPDYPTARRRLEDLMAGRKLTRSFGPSPIARVADPAPRLPKSTLDGTRESVIDERLFAEGGDGPRERLRKATHLYERFGARPAERMSGVDVLKRRGRPGSTEADIPSTSHFAALPLLQRTAGDRDPKLVGAHIKKLEQYGARPEPLDTRFAPISLSGGYDAGILFPERLAEEVDRADLDEARGTLADLLQAATNATAPEPYYALLVADGDFMGDTIERFQTSEEHRAFSRALSDFASGVRAIVEHDHQGALVYAGGDDVLAFLPLHTVLDCAQALAQVFRERIGGIAGALPAGAHSPSLSVGITISHHIEPLADALGLARAAEDFAKALPGKNALAITLSKRSGVDRSIRGRWGADEAGGAFLGRLREFIRLHRAEAIPDGAAYELRDLAVRLGNAPVELHHALEPAIRSNAIGIFERKRGRRGDEKVAAKVITDIRVALGLVAEPVPGETIDVATLADELIIAREFARALGPLPKEAAAPEGAR